MYPFHSQNSKHGPLPLVKWKREDLASEGGDGVEKSIRVAMTNSDMQ